MSTKRKNFRFIAFIGLIILMLAGSGVTGDMAVVRAESTVYITRTGSKYHTHKCGNGTYYPTTLSDAQARGLTPCSKCFGSGYTPAQPQKPSATVKPVKINKTSLLLVKGQTAKLKISNAAGKVTWSSSKKAVASVSSGGKVKAKKKGKTVITARIGGQTKKCSVQVEAPKLNLSEVSLNLSETKQLKLSGCKHSVKWSTSNASVAGVKKGKITAKGVGTAKVTAAVHGKKFVCKVTVRKPELKQLTLEKTSVQMGYEKEMELKIGTVPSNAADYYDVSVQSSNPSVVSASFDSYVNVLVLESHDVSGTAVVSVTLGNMTAKCQVEVIPSVITSLSLDESALVLKPDGWGSIYCNVTPHDADMYYDAKWTSSDESVATVTGSFSGLYAYIEAVGEGETDITLTLGSKSATCHVTVAKPEITGLSLSETEITMKPDEWRSIEYDVTPYEASSYYEAEWTSADESVAVLTDTSSSGIYAYIEAVGEGETDITLTLGNRKVVCHVNVQK